MPICIDSCVFIQAIQCTHPAASRLFSIISPELQLVIPRLVAKEVTRNLRYPEEQHLFFQLFQDPATATIVDGAVPQFLLETYVGMGLPAKADAFIGAFMEWAGIPYLVSHNRHFLRLTATSFQVLNAATFLSRWEAGVL